MRANNILADNNLDKNNLQNSINLINKSIKAGLFDELVYGYWLHQCKGLPSQGLIVFCNPGPIGVPLAPDIFFLIGDKEKSDLEKLVTIQ